MIRAAGLFPCLILSALLPAVWTCDGQVSAAARHDGNFCIQYENAGRSEVEIRDGTLLRIWYTLKEGSHPVPRSPAGYDRHESRRDLTTAELASFRKWASRDILFRLLDRDVAPVRTSYGSAFRTSLKIRCDDRSSSITWTGDTRLPPELQEAVRDFHDRLRTFENP